MVEKFNKRHKPIIPAAAQGNTPKPIIPILGSLTAGVTPLTTQHKN